MKKQKPEDIAYKQAIADFRKKYFKELDTDMKKLLAIRDAKHTKEIKCPHCKQKFEAKINNLGLMKMQIESIKIIARHLGVLAPEKIEKKETGGSKKETPFTKAETEAIRKRTASVLGESWTELNVKH